MAVPEDAIDRDLLLTNVSLYWFTGTSGQSAVPTGLYSGPPGIRRLAERHNDIVHWGENRPGSHHFIAMELPEVFAEDIREFFGKLR
ncbi:hypothetical protein [Actinoallomurus sp. NPDC050550]|uniref:hypothetical protein n=1 Tax=Actinoallomurus sp. NPDC050550 TaxID=3154937 RepID=UPI0033E5DC27